ncbi:MAG: hypothetical protein ACD_76C00144G0005 [uncultured bacterium]|nr:MAG: hypothetical protein ACD_76C00144G0005 [uncultured bacterium]HBD05020.1 phospho-N-acetylmuramoyl-pentapeptide-transferase [Candidatus Uhrbacteria bacterium]
MSSFDLVRVLLMSAMAFVIAIAWTPALTHVLYKYKLGKTIRDEKSAPIFYRLHLKKSGTPTMGGALVWGTVLALILFIHLLTAIFPDSTIAKFDFLSRAQTLLPLGALVASALVGLVDDYFNVKGIGPNGGGLRMRHRLLIYSLIAIVGAWWFYFKLDWHVMHVPFFGLFDIGAWYIPIFFFVIVATSFAVNQTDGLDGLAGGSLLMSFASYAAIALMLGRPDLAVFCGAISGALLAFLWFNIPPARFFMGDTGSMSLGVTLGIIAMLTNMALLLPVIGFVFVIVTVSSIIQLTSKKIRKKKVFLSSPIHHHLEAIGWSESKIVMRFWVISMISAALGVALALLDSAAI